VKPTQMKGKSELAQISEEQTTPGGGSTCPTTAREYQRKDIDPRWYPRSMGTKGFPEGQDHPPHELDPMRSLEQLLQIVFGK